MILLWIYEHYYLITYLKNKCEMLQILKQVAFNKPWTTWFPHLCTPYRLLPMGPLYSIVPTLHLGFISWCSRVMYRSTCPTVAFFLASFYRFPFFDRACTWSHLVIKMVMKILTGQCGSHPHQVYYGLSNWSETCCSMLVSRPCSSNCGRLPSLEGSSESSWVGVCVIVMCMLICPYLI